MNNLPQHIPAQLDDILQSMWYFIPEIILVALFIKVFVLDLIFGKRYPNLSRYAAIAGVVGVLFTDLLQLSNITESRFIFNGMLLFQHS